MKEVLLDDIVNYYSDFRKSGEKSIVLESLNDTDLEIFGKYYCRILNSI